MTLRMRVLPRFPARIEGGAGINIERPAGSTDLTVTFDISNWIRVPSVTDPNKVFFPVWNSDLDTYSVMSFTDTFQAVIDTTGLMLDSVYDPQNKNADAFARANHTGTQAISTVSGLQTALDAKAATTYVDAQTALKVNKAGDTMTDTLTLQRLVNAFWVGLKVRNTGNSDAAIQLAAANRDFSSGTHIEFGQRADGRGYIYVAGKQWVINNSGDMALPNSGTLYGTGDIFCAYSGLNTLLSTVLGRMRQIRLAAEATNNVNRSGWNIAPNGAYVTGIFKDSSGEIQNYAYRYIQQTDLFGNWANVPTL